MCSERSSNGTLPKMSLLSVVQHQDRETDFIFGGFQDWDRQSHCWPVHLLKNPYSTNYSGGLDDFQKSLQPISLYFCNSQSPILHCYLSCCVPWLSPFPPFPSSSFQKISLLFLSVLCPLFSVIYTCFLAHPPPVISSFILTYDIWVFGSYNPFMHLSSRSSHLIGVCKFQMPAQPPLSPPLPSIFISLFHQSSSCSANPQIFSCLATLHQ